jgi:oligoribonuclease
MKIYWLDVESSGLSPERDQLLELAVAEADLERPFDIGPISQWVFRGIPCHPDGTAALSPLILDMHTKSGLVAECAKSTTTVSEIENHLLTLVPEVADREDIPTLAGSSVHFDHAFLRAKMPRLAARFSHRHYDVSAVKLFCRSLGMPKLPKAEAHRASADILESVEHARACAEWLRSFSYADLHDRTVSVVEDLKGGR